VNGLLLFMLDFELCRTDSFYRTDISTCTAINTFVGIDNIDIAFRNSFRRTFRQACTTSSAFITNNISHNIKILSYKSKYKLFV